MFEGVIPTRTLRPIEELRHQVPSEARRLAMHRQWLAGNAPAGNWVMVETENGPRPAYSSFGLPRPGFGILR